MIFNKFVFNIIFLVSSASLSRPRQQKYYQTRRQTAEYNEGGFPSYPSPPETIKYVTPEINVNGVSPGPVGPSNYNGYYFGRPPTTLPPDDDDDAETTTTEPAEEPAPFGFEETILILVPQFKYKIHGFPKWCGASVKLSFPITSKDSAQ